MCGWFTGTFRRDFCQTLYMFGTSHCCDSSSCLSNMCEHTPALVGAERRTWLFERAVRALRSTSNLMHAVVSLKHTPNECKRVAAITRRRDRTLPRMRLVADKANWKRKESTHFHYSLAYTTTGFGAFSNVPGKKRTLCGQCERKTQKTSDVQPTCKKQLFDGEHKVQRWWTQEKAQRRWKCKIRKCKVL